MMEGDDRLIGEDFPEPLNMLHLLYYYLLSPILNVRSHPRPGLCPRSPLFQVHVSTSASNPVPGDRIHFFFFFFPVLLLLLPRPRLSLLERRVIESPQSTDGSQQVLRSDVASSTCCSLPFHLLNVMMSATAHLLCVDVNRLPCLN